MDLQDCTIGCIFEIIFLQFILIGEYISASKDCVFDLLFQLIVLLVYSLVQIGTAPSEMFYNCFCDCLRSEKQGLCTPFFRMVCAISLYRSYVLLLRKSFDLGFFNFLNLS